MKQLAEFILASGSPRRKDLLGLLGLKFEVNVSDVDETQGPNEGAEEMVARLSRLKSKVIAERFPDTWILAADTTVLLDGEILGKPVNAAEAKNMLSKLSGRTHRVWSAFTFRKLSQHQQYTESVQSDVQFVSINSQDIDDYIASGEPMDKAGAYAFQGIGAAFIKKVVGSHTNIIGLPLAEVIQAMKTYKIVE